MRTDQPTILVTGATGAVGRHLVATLLERGASVRALTRKPADTNLPAGVEVVAGDLADAATLGAEVFDGVDRAFVFPARGIDVFMDAAVAAGVHRCTVLSSLAAALEFPRDHGSASQLHHSAVEAAVTTCTDAWTILRPGTFANNLLEWRWPITSGATLRVPYPTSAQAPVHEYDVAEAAAETLLSDNHIGEIIPITGPEALTRADQIATLSTGLGRDIPWEEITADEFRTEMAQFIPAPIMKMLLDYWSDTVSTPDRPRPATVVTGKPGRTLADWVTDHRSDFGA
ncbi:NAD-dependent epimerase/dehydratase family protein [Nocardia stercoris]|uniref:NAD-dependent epimerase/dehydratase family protein n=1 Tax=Nocardia stercoris TaxID=2483361 RepID=A0A3M2L8X6_9NOCA|nr:NAD-dependent epimerase/dehydratase family protein [Nocardia stercoris]